MAINFIDQLFGFLGYLFLDGSANKSKVEISIQKEANELCCSRCHGKNIKRRGTKTRKFRTVPIGKKAVFVVLILQRIECLDCGCVRQEEINFAGPKKRYTQAFERYVLELSKYMTILDVARHLGISWDMVKDIQKRYLTKRFSKPKLRNLRLIAIDEISIGSHHKYLMVLMDLLSGAVIFVGDGKGADSLLPFWQRLKKSQAKIEAVAIDMSPAYIEAVSTHLPQAAIVFDHFHVIKLFNDKLSKLRRELYREATDSLDKEVLKGTMWLLLKNPENLNEEKNEQKRLREALKLNEPLATTYYMREDLRQLWSQDDKSKAEIFLQDWIARARCSGVRMLNKFANTLAAHRSGILAYYDYPISTGPLEGTNNKIKTMQRQAYGFRDMEFFKLKILALHETKYALVG